jgi:hypothetical protein
VRPHDEAFLEAALSTVALPSDKARCRHVLEDALGHTATLVPPPQGDALETVTLRLQRTAHRPPRRKTLRLVLMAGAVLAALWPGLVSRDVMTSANATGISFVPWDGFQTPPARLLEAGIAPRLSPEARLTLFGDISRETATDRWEGAWRAHPEDPVLFNRYAFAVLTAEGTLPDDFLATGAKIDPGNGWYRFFDAAVTWHITQTTSKPSDPMPAFLEAMAMPRFESHRDEFLRRQIAVLPPARDYGELSLNRRLLATTVQDLYASIADLFGDFQAFLVVS